MATQEISLLEGLLVSRNDIDARPVLPTCDRLDRLLEDAKRELPKLVHDAPAISACVLRNLDLLTDIMASPPREEPDWDVLKKILVDEATRLDKVEARMVKLHNRTMGMAEFEHQQSETETLLQKARDDLKRVNDNWLEAKAEWGRTWYKTRLIVTDLLVTMTIDCLRYALGRQGVIMRVWIRDD